MKLQERDLEIDFTDAVDAIVFDQMKIGEPHYHGIGQMHRVDFIVEFDEAIIFVEIKDPSNPNAQDKDVANFRQKMNEGVLSSNFAEKFIDSFLYRWAEDKIAKPVYYVNLVTLEAELLPNFSDELAKKLPPMGKAVPRWKRQLAENCQVFNIETWNENFPKWPVTRLPA